MASKLSRSAMNQSVTADDEWSAERLSRACYQELGSQMEIEGRFLRHLLSSSSCLVALQNLLASPESTSSRDYSLEIDVFDLLIGNHAITKFSPSVKARTS